MRRDIAIAGFFLTAEEWEALDPTSRAQLLAAVLRRDLWTCAAPPPRADAAEAAEKRFDFEGYEAYELVWAA